MGKHWTAEGPFGNLFRRENQMCRLCRLTTVGLANLGKSNHSCSTRGLIP